MDQQGSTPDLENGGQQDHSQDNSSADNAAQNEQPSQSEDTGVVYSSDEATGNGYFEDDSEDDAPSQTTDEDDDTTGEESDDETNSVDPELQKWASSQNISLETPTEIALAKRLRDTQKAFHGKSNESKKKFEQASAPDEGDVPSELQSIQQKLARAEFFEQNPGARELEEAMFDYAVNLLESGDKAGFDYYRTPSGWKALYQIVKAEQAEIKSNDSYETGRKDERTNLAKKSQAAAPATSAVNSAPTSTQVTDAQIGKMTQAEYEQFRRDNPDWNPFG